MESKKKWDAVCHHPKNSETMFFFKNNEYYSYTWGIGVDSGYPKSISSQWKGVPDNIDAALNHPTDTKYIFFFKGDEYYRYNYDNKEVDSAYPIKIGVKNGWKGIPADIDTIVSSPHNPKELYFFKGEKFYKYIWSVGIEDGYPKNVSEYAKNAPSNMDLIFNSPNNNYTFIFKDDKYYRYRWNSNFDINVDSGYPKNIAYNWKGLNNERRVNNYSKNSWMGDLFDQLKDKTLLQLTLPGTHDSGTNALKNEIAPDIEPIVKILWENFRFADDATGAGSYIKGMATAQSLSIKEQLEAGIRYIDLRVCWMDSDFYTCHSLQGSKISEILTDVSSFLEQNKKEIIVFKVAYKGKFDESNKNKLDESDKDEFKKLFGDILTESYFGTYDEIKGKTIENLIEDKHRVLFCEKECIEGIYDEHANTNSQVIKLLKEKTKEFYDPTKSRTKLLEAQLFRPISNPKGMVAGAIKASGCKVGSFLPVLVPIVTSLKENASNSRSIIKEYCMSREGLDKPNIIICDYFQDVPLVDIAIYMSINKSYTSLISNLSDESLIPLDSFPMSLVNCQLDKMIMMLKLAKFQVETIAKLIKGAYDLSAKAAAEALKQAGYAAKEVGKALKDIYNLGDKAAAEALKQAGYTVKEVEKVLQDVYNLGKEAVAKALKQAGYTAKEVGKVLQDVYNLSDKAAAKALNQAGYGAKEVGKALKDVYTLSDKAVAEALKQAGYAKKEIEKIIGKISDLLPWHW